MRTELRFLLAISLMILVLVGTNLLFPPPPPQQPATEEPVATTETGSPSEAGTQVDEAEADPTAGVGDRTAEESRPASGADTQAGEAPAVEEQAPPRLVTVEGPLYRFTFTTRGGRLISAELLGFNSFTRDGPVDLIPDGGRGAMGLRLLTEGRTVDLSERTVRIEPEGGLVISPDGGSGTLTVVADPQDGDPGFELVYTFHPDLYSVGVQGRVIGAESAVIFTDLGDGLSMNETRPQDEERAMAYVISHTQEGIRVVSLPKVEAAATEEGPLYWAAFKSKFFAMGFLAGLEPDTPDAHLGGALVEPGSSEFRAGLEVSQPAGQGGTFEFRLFAGPQDYQRLRDQGRGFQNLNSYGWRMFRPVIRPFVGIIMTILVFLHENLRLGYGWVLIVFGVMMRVVLWPLNHKAMKAQLRNMAVQPLLQEIQTKYKDQPEKLQKELMKLYKEHGFNPLAGCLPMLLPWPVLIALFFVFQNTIELRAVPFLWLSDLSAPDPFYILPILLGLSMFVLQWISLRTMETPNPQMKAMMWIMPFFMLFIFANLASGLNLYYATANIATLPQQYWIAGERKRAQAQMKGAAKKEP
jgi:YidC/Oxa1 family membrane protein insertase